MPHRRGCGITRSRGQGMSEHSAARDGSLPEGIAQWSSFGVHSLRRDKFGVPTCVDSDVPFLSVHDDMVRFA